MIFVFICSQKLKLLNIDNQMEIEKVYFTISEVAERFQVNTSLVRYWEKEFNFFKPKKNKQGNRIYVQADIDCFQAIYQLVKIQGYTLQGAKDHLRDKYAEVKQTRETIQLLRKIRAELIDLRDGIQ